MLHRLHQQLLRPSPFRSAHHRLLEGQQRLQA